MIVSVIIGKPTNRRYSTRLKGDMSGGGGGGGEQRHLAKSECRALFVMRPTEVSPLKVHRSLIQPDDTFNFEHLEGRTV